MPKRQWDISNTLPNLLFGNKKHGILFLLNNILFSCSSKLNLQNYNCYQLDVFLKNEQTFDIHFENIFRKFKTTKSMKIRSLVYL
jgi:hypothetical protein